MSYIKRRIEKQPVYTHEPINNFVCHRCVTDQYLAHILREASQEFQCSYCRRCNAAELSVLFDALSEAIQHHYNDPAEELPYEGQEGGYQGQWWDGYSLFQEEVRDWTNVPALLEDASKAFADGSWCYRDSFGMPEDEALKYSWGGFAEKVKHQTRYLFFGPSLKHTIVDIDAIAPADMLNALGNLFLDLDLLRALPSGHKLVRARVVKQHVQLSGPEDIGTPPTHLATVSNRMSPAGIPMFYGAFESETAIAETFDPTVSASHKIAIGHFTTLVDLEVVDLSQLPDIPSFFDPAGWRRRDSIRFLHSFVEDLTRPIQRDSHRHIDYVPTQVVTEYVRHRLLTRSGHPISGVIYQSSRTQHEAIVLFADAQQCGSSVSKQTKPSQPLMRLEQICDMQPPPNRRASDSVVKGAQSQLTQQ